MLRHCALAWLAGFPTVLISLLLAVVSLASGYAEEETAAETLSSYSFDRPWQVTSYDNEAGVSQERVFDIAFESDGTVWLATSDGLRRYNGYSWESNYGTNAGLPSSFVRSVRVTHSGELWVGMDCGAGVYDYKKHKFDTRGSEKGLAGHSVRNIVEDPDGTLWFCCDRWPNPSVGGGGLTALRQGVWKSYRVQDGLPIDYVLNYFKDNSGRQYAMTLRGWVVWSEGRWRPYGSEVSEHENRIISMTQARNGALIASGEFNSFAVLNGRWQNIGRDVATVGAKRDGTVLAVGRDSERASAWFSVWDGEKFVRKSAIFPCAAGGLIYKVVEAPDGAVWCVGKGSVIRWDCGVGPFQLHPNLPRPSLCDTRGRVWFSGGSKVVVQEGADFRPIHGMSSLLAVDASGRGWGVSGAGDNLVCVAPGGAEAQSVDCGLTHIYQIHTNGHGGVWVIGTTPTGGFGIARRDGSRWEMMRAPELKTNIYQGGSVNSRGDLWVTWQPRDSVIYGVGGVKNGEFQSLKFNSGPPPIMYPSFAEAAGYYWLSSYSALYRTPVSTNDWRRVDTIGGARFGQMLAGTDEVCFLLGGGREGQSAGCALFRNGRWVTESGAFSQAFLDRDGTTLFFGARGGVYARKTPGTLQLDYLPIPVDVYPKSVVRDCGDNSLWIGTPDGALRYRPSKVPPEIRITSALTEASVGSTLHVVFGGIRKFANNNPPSAFQYSWRFDQSPWSEFQQWPGNEVPLNGMAVGRHRLEIRARDFDGNVTVTPAALTFTVLPVPLQQQVWFKPILALTIGLIIALIWLGVARTRQIALTNAALREEVGMRSQTEAKLKEAHDQLEQRVAERTAELSRANGSLAHEIGERKQAEEMRLKLEEQLRHVHKMQAVGTMAGGIAHDFNNILATIIPYTHLAIEATTEQPDVQEDLKQVLIAADRARVLVQQILTFSGKQRRERRVVDLGPVITEGMQLVRTVIPPTVEIFKKVAPDLPTVLADGNQIQQVLINLCTNAAHAMKNRSGVLEVVLDSVEVDAQGLERNVQLHPGLYVRLAVRDNGCGMSESVQERIFEPFFTTKGQGEGTGMGLAVVHGIVTDHGGVISLKTQEGVGTSFEIFLPAHQPSGGSISATASAPVGRGLRILLVDDEQALCSVLSQLLSHLGYKVTAFNRPKPALREFLARPAEFDMLFTDLSMPEMNGVELAKKILEIRPGLPVLLATGYGVDAELEYAASIGITKTVAKPIYPGALVELIQSTLKAAAAQTKQ